MSPETIFNLSNGIAMLGWLILIFFSPFVLEIDKFLVGIFVCLLAIIYGWLLIQSFQPADVKNFGSLDGVMKLFQNKTLVTAGWVHYLAFDLLTGVWIRRNADRHGVPNALVIFCLLFTFMVGPIGLLLYLLIRSFNTGSYFSSNY